MENEPRPRSVLGLFFSITKRHRQAVEDYCEKNDLQKSQHRMMFTLNHLGDGTCQKDVAEHLQITPAAVAVTLKKLERSGVVKKEIRDEDNRYNRIYMTDKGKEIVKQSIQAFNAIDNAAFSGVTEDEMDELTRILNKIHANLKKLNGEESEEKE